jgi:hypothetical protein
MTHQFDILYFFSLLTTPQNFGIYNLEFFYPQKSLDKENAKKVRD